MFSKMMAMLGAACSLFAIARSAAVSWAPAAATSPARLSLPFCTSSDDYTAGRFERLLPPRPPRAEAPPYPCPRIPLPQFYVHQVMRYEPDTESARVERQRSFDSTRWVWVPDKCRLRPFDSAAFVGSLRNGTALFTGDSLNEFMADELACLLDADGFVESAERSTYSPGWSRVVLKAGAGQIRYLRNDLLVDGVTGTVRDAVGDHHRFQHDWVAAARSMGPSDLLVLNAGAHWGGRVEYEPTFNIWRDGGVNYVNMTATVVRALAAVGFRGRVAYRSSVGGHVGCRAATEPAATYDAARALYGDGAYNWHALNTDFMLLAWQRAVADHAPAWLRSRFTFLDVGMTRLRPDGHIVAGYEDCLHYLVPGPMTTWVALLHNLVVDPVRP